MLALLTVSAETTVYLNCNFLHKVCAKIDNLRGE